MHKGFSLVFNFHELPLLLIYSFFSVTKCICVSKMSHTVCSSLGSPTQDSLRPKPLYSLSLLYPLSPCIDYIWGQELHSLPSCIVLPSPGTPPEQLKQRQWGDSISLLFKEGGKINHSGWAFVPICHRAAITIPFSTLFILRLKCLDVTVNLTSSAVCLCSSITLILQI